MLLKKIQECTFGKEYAKVPSRAIIDNIGNVIIDARSHKNYPVHHQTGENIHLCDVHRTLFNNCR